MYQRRVKIQNQEYTAFLKAVQAGETETVKHILKNRKIQTSQLSTVLAIAVKNGYEDIVCLLLKKRRTDPSDGDNLAFRLAAANGHLNIMRQLLTDARVLCNTQNNQAFCDAVNNNHMEVVKFFLANKKTNISPNAQDNYPLNTAVMQRNLEMVSILLRDERVYPEDHDLWFAAEKDYVEIADLLLKYGADPVGSNGAPLIRAAQWGSINVVKLLVEIPQVRSHSNCSRALLLASARGHIEIVHLLLNNTMANPAEGFYLALENNHFEITVLLLQHEKMEFKEGYLMAFALTQAFKKGHKDIIISLIMHNKLHIPSLQTAILEFDEDDIACKSFILSCLKQRFLFKDKMLPFFFAAKKILPKDLILQISDIFMQVVLNTNNSQDEEMQDGENNAMECISYSDYSGKKFGA